VLATRAPGMRSAIQQERWNSSEFQRAGT